IPLNELLGTNGVPERDIRWPCEEGPGALDEGLNVWLLHVRPQEDLLAWPMLDQREARWIARVLQHGDAAAIWLQGLDRGDEIANLTRGRVRVFRQRTIADEYDCSAHTASEQVGMVPNALCLRI